MSENDDGEVTEQRLRVMQLLHCEAGRALDPDNGPPIAILTLAHKGEIEQPLMLDLKDVRRLTAEFLCVLAEFNDETAIQIHAQFIVSGRHGGSVLAGDPPAAIQTVINRQKPEPAIESPKPSQTAGLQPSGLYMRVRVGSGHRTHRFAILGGYQNGRGIYVIVRNESVPNHPEFMTKLGPKWTITLKVKGQAVLPRPLWPVFGDLAAGQEISIGGILWRKLDRSELLHVVAGRTFTVKRSR